MLEPRPGRIDQYLEVLFTMQDHSTTVTKGTMPTATPLTVEQEQLVISSQTIIRQMAWNMARDSRAYLEVDDLISAGNEAICDAVRRLPADCRNPEGYLCKVAQYTMIHVRIRENAATVLAWLKR